MDKFIEKLSNLLFGMALLMVGFFLSWYWVIEDLFRKGKHNAVCR